nr:L-histidine N(alpha)-methyltransferase [Calditrichia bacterium]
MSARYRILQPGDLDGLLNPSQAFGLEVLHGLSEHPKRLSSKFFYDDEGSRIFQQIMGLEEYYPTRCEYEILENNRGDIGEHLRGEAFNLVELGAGDGLKTNLLISRFLEKGMQFAYVPIDISAGAMNDLSESLIKKFPNLTMAGIVAEYFEALKWLSSITDKPSLILFLGSNLGNFSSSQARTFLRSLWNTLKEGDLVLIGFDLKKNIDVMLEAYNDRKGVTAAFNLNLLRRINRELGGNFSLDTFRFFATYNVFSGAIESYLVSKEEQDVYIEAVGQSFHFKAWEPIHTEYSYKYLISDIERLAAKTGFIIEK